MQPWLDPSSLGEAPDSLGVARWPWLPSAVPDQSPRMTPDGLPTSAPAGMQMPPWLSPLQGQGQTVGDRVGPRWPWLRGEPGAEVPGFNLNPDGSSGPPDAESVLKLMSGAYDVPSPEVDGEIVGDAAKPSSDLPTAPTDGLAQALGVGGSMATSMALPNAGEMVGGQAARAAFARVASALIGGGATIASRVSPASLAWSFVVPTNTQSETIDIGEGLRARLRPGQRSVEIERQADNGLFGTGLGAHWETLPVDAELNVADDGSHRVQFDYRQLERAVGPEAAARAWDAIGSAMARPPKKREEDGSQPPAGIGHNSGQVPAPGGGGQPPSGPNALTTAAELGIEALKKQSSTPDPFDAQTEGKLLEERRRVMKAHREQAPDGQYRGDDGFDTAVGIRMHPNLPDPSAGRDYSPDPKDPHLVKGYMGELELNNRIATHMPQEVVVHYGNAAGQHGPDAVSVNPDGHFTVWESKYRTAERSIGPNNIPARSEDSFQNLRRLAADSIRQAMKEGRLDPEVGDKALENARQGHFIISTVGTGNAHEGQVEFVRYGVRSKPRRP
jgi:hypothetical protein